MMYRMFIASLIFVSTSSALAKEMVVIDVRRNITLSNDEPVYKDFYINAGEGSGLKKNLVVTVMRKLNIRDWSGATSYGEILVPVGQLRILAVFGKIAIAREYKMLSRDEYPMLEQYAIMSGDEIDTKGSFIDSSKPKRKVAGNEEHGAAEGSEEQTNPFSVSTMTPTAQATAMPNAGPSPAAMPPSAATLNATPPETTISTPTQTAVPGIPPTTNPQQQAPVQQTPPGVPVARPNNPETETL